MNTRCYRCGRSFTIGREEIEAAAVASAGQKFHVVYCPNCRTAIKMPMEQVMRELPPGWEPPAPTAGESEAAAEAPVAEKAAAAPGQEMVAVVVGVHKSHRRHRHGKSADVPVEIAPVEPIFLAEPPAPEQALELEPPAPKQTRKREATTEAEAAKPAAKPRKPAAAAKKTSPAAKKSASTAKKTARKSAAPKKK